MIFFFWLFFLETAYMTGQNDCQTQILSGQIVIFAKHCPVTGRYFEPCKVYAIWPQVANQGL